MPLDKAVGRLLLSCKGKNQKSLGSIIEAGGMTKRRVPGKAKELCLVVSGINPFSPKDEIEQEILCYRIKNVTLLNRGYRE